MHTVRNRIASRPPVTSPALADLKPPLHRSSREELTRLLRTGAPSVAQPPTPVLALPTAPLTAAAWPAQAMPDGPAHAVGQPPAVGLRGPERKAPAENRPQKRRNPKGKKARKAAARKAAAATPQATMGRGGKLRSPAPIHHEVVPAPPAAASPAIPPAAPAVHPIPEVESDAMFELCLQAEPALALMLPSRAEPLVETHEPAAARVLMLASMPELLVEKSAEVVLDDVQRDAGHAAEVAPALTLPAMPEPLVALLPASLAEPRRTSATGALAAIADAQAAPLPRSRALVPARRQGLVDVIAFLLRDSGRRLARWSARRHKTRAEFELIRSAEARQRALFRELEALDALQRNRG